MVVSNELNANYLLETAVMMFDLAVMIKHVLDVEVEFINLGGGVGIPYRPEQQPVDLAQLGQRIRQAYERIMVPAGLGRTWLCLESGRMMTGPYGWLVSTVLHLKHTYKHYAGLDSCMADLMRPALYGAYHHITVVGKEDAPHNMIYDVTALAVREQR